MIVAKRKQIDAICVAAIVFGLILTVLFMNGERFGIRTAIDADSEAHSDDEYFTENDLDGSWDTSKATKITLAGNDATVSGVGAYAYNGGAVIANSGTYVVSGELTDGSLVVDANDNSKVWILLDGVTISNEDDACIVVDQADKVFLTLADGSTNTLTSGSSFGEEALQDNTDGVIFAHDDLTINGSGSLVATTGYGHGISANDDLVITGGSITVKAPKDAIHANDSLRVANATIDVTAEDDGLVADNEGSYVYVESGTISVVAGDEGMTAAGDMTIAGGNLTITTGTESGCHGMKAGGTCTILGGTVSMPACYEGIQAHYIDMQGGDVSVFPTDDGLNASSGTSTDMGMGQPGGGQGGPGGQGGQGGQGGMGHGFMDTLTGLEGVTIEGESVSITEQGAQNILSSLEASGTSTEVTAEELMACTTPQELFQLLGKNMRGGRADMGGEQAQGNPPEGAPQGGEASGASSQESADAGSTTADDQKTGDMPQQGQGRGAQAAPTNGEASSTSATDTSATDATAAESSADDAWIHVSGGSILVVNQTAMDADGLDSNGSIVISGGDVRVSLSSNGSNNAIDFASENGGVCEINGGTVVACGSSSMMESLASTSTQCSIMYNTSAGFEAGQMVSLQDAAGNELLSYEVPCNFSSVILSCPQLAVGGTYRIVVGDTVEEVTPSEVATTAGDAQGMMQGGMQGGGRGMGGGMQGGNMAGGMADGQQGPGNMNPADGQNEPTTDSAQDKAADTTTAAAANTTTSGGQYTTETLVICTVSLPILLIGLVVALGFRRR